MDQSTIAITDGEGNAIVIRAKLNFGQMTRVQSAGLKMHIRPGAETENDIEMDWPAYQERLLIEACIGWHGPRFAGIVFSRDALLSLEADDPLLQKVLTEVSTLNNKVSRDPKAPASATSGAKPSPVIENEPAQSANGTGISN